MSGSHLSKDFFELVKAIGESKSKQEEDRIIMNEVGVLKKKMPEANVAREKMKEFLVRMIYVEMLGHDASFAYIKVSVCGLYKRVFRDQGLKRGVFPCTTTALCLHNHREEFAQAWYVCTVCVGCVGAVVAAGQR